MSGVSEDDVELDALRAAALKSMRAKTHLKPKPGKHFADKNATNGSKYSNLIVLTSNDNIFEREKVKKAEVSDKMSHNLSSNEASMSSTKSTKRVLPGRFSRLEKDEDSEEDTDDYSEEEDNSNALLCAFNDQMESCIDSHSMSDLDCLSDTHMTSIVPKPNASIDSDSNVCNADNCMINSEIVDMNDVKCSSYCHDINVKNDKIKLKINNNTNVESIKLLEMRKLKFGDISADNQCLDRCNESVSVKYNDCSVKNQNDLNTNRKLKTSNDFAFNNYNNNSKTSNSAYNNRVNNMTLRAHKTFGRKSDSRDRDCDDNNDKTGSTKKKLRSLVVIK